MDTRVQRKRREKFLALAAFGTLAVALGGAATGSMIGNTSMIERTGHSYELPQASLAPRDDSRTRYFAKTRTIDGEVVHRGELRYVGREQPSYFDEDLAWVPVEYIPVDGLTSSHEYGAAPVTRTDIERAEDVARDVRSQSPSAAKITIVRGTQKSVEATRSASGFGAETEPQVSGMNHTAASLQVSPSGGSGATGG